jgi:hypothetical protein
MNVLKLKRVSLRHRFPSIESMTMHDADFSILNNSLAIKSLYV